MQPAILLKIYSTADALQQNSQNFQNNLFGKHFWAIASAMPDDLQPNSIHFSLLIINDFISTKKKLCSIPLEVSFICYFLHANILDAIVACLYSNDISIQ